jgi:hypothetical protein
MTQYSLLERTLSANLTWNRARIKFLSRFLIALIKVRTVNLVEIAVCFEAGAKVSSNYKRIQRFFRFFDFELPELARLILALMNLKPPFVLCLDRTEWQFGKRWLNVLMISVATDSVSIPLLWLVLEKKGCSNFEERKQLFEEYLKAFGSESIKYLCADREFADKAFLKYLGEEQIDFRIRLKQNAQITDKRGKRMRASKLLQTSRQNVILNCRRWRKLWNLKVAIAAVRREQNEFVIVVSSEASGEILPEYAVRWQIETLFGCLKRRGFCLEETHLKDGERVSKLLGLLNLAFCWSLLAGELVCRRRPIKLKKHGRLEKSVFRAGFDYLRRQLSRQTNNGQKQENRKLILLLSCT